MQSEISLIFFHLGNLIVLQKLELLLPALLSILSCCLSLVSFCFGFTFPLLCSRADTGQMAWLSSLSNFSYSRGEIGWEEQCSSSFIIRKICGEMKNLKDLWTHNEVLCCLYNSLSTTPWLSRTKISVRSADIDSFLCWPSPGMTE